MKSGSNNLTVFASDITGGPVTGLSTGWQILGAVADIPITAFTIAPAAAGPGFYIATLNLPVGEGFISFDNATPGVFISPDWADIDTTQYSTDDVYARTPVPRIVPNIPLGSPLRYSTVQLSTKEDTDITEVIQIPTFLIPGLSGATSMTLACYPPAALTNSMVPAISGTYSASILSAVDGTIQIHIGDDVLAGQVPQGQQSVILYGDINYFDNQGYERSPVELNITVRRKFNTD